MAGDRDEMPDAVVSSERVTTFQHQEKTLVASRLTERSHKANAYILPRLAPYLSN